MQQLAHQQPGGAAQHGQQQVLPQGIGCRLRRIKAQYLYRGNLPDALHDVDVGQIAEDDKGKGSRADHHQRHDHVETLHGIADRLLLSGRQGNIADAVLGAQAGRKPFTAVLAAVAEVGGVIFCPVQRFRRHIDIVAQIVFRYARNGEAQAVAVVCLQRHLISLADVHHFGKMNREDRLSLPGILQIPSVVVQADRLFQLFPLSGHQLDGMAFRAVVQFRVHLVAQGPGFRLILPQRLRFCIRIQDLRVVVHQHVIMADLAVLVIRHIGDGVLHAEARHQQGCAAPYAQNHQHNAGGMAESVSQGDLAQEREPFPQRLYPLQQNTLSGLGRFGADQLRRALAQFLAAGQHRDRNGAEQRHRHAGRAHPHAEVELQGGIAVNNIVCVPDDERDHRNAHHKAQNTAHKGRASGVPQIFSHDHPAGIAHGLQSADLGALVIDHTGHGGHADQRRNEHEEHRERPRHGGDDAGVVFEGDAAGVGLPVQREYFQFQLFVGFFYRVGIRSLRVLQFFSAVGKLLLRLGFPFFILYPALIDLPLGLFQLHPSLVQLLLALGHGHFGIFNLRLGGVQLRSAFGNGPLSGGDLRLSCGDLGFGLVQFRFRRGDLRFLGGKLLRRAVPCGHRVLSALLEPLHPGVEQGKPGLVADGRGVKGVDILLHLTDLLVDKRDRLLIGPEHGLLRGLQLCLALGQLLFARLDLGDSRFQLRFALLKLLFLLVQHGAIFFDLFQRAGDLRPAVIDLFLFFLDLFQAVVDVHLALDQGRPGAAKLLLGLFLALAVFFPALIQLGSGLRQFLVRLIAELLIAAGSPAVQQALYLRLQPVPGGSIFRGIQLPRQIAVQQDLLKNLLAKGLVRQKHKAAELS